MKAAVAEIRPKTELEEKHNALVLKLIQSQELCNAGNWSDLIELYSTMCCEDVEYHFEAMNIHFTGVIAWVQFMENIHAASPDAMEEIVSIECSDNSVTFALRFIGSVIDPREPVGLTGEMLGDQTTYLTESNEDHLEKKVAAGPPRRQMLSISRTTLEVDSVTNLVKTINVMVDSTDILPEGYVYKPLDFKW